jgi:hypothetical protein
MAPRCVLYEWMVAWVLFRSVCYIEEREWQLFCMAVVNLYLCVVCDVPLLSQFGVCGFS